MGLDWHEGSGGGFVFFFFFLGLTLLDCVQFLFGVKMKENKRRFWIGGSVCVVIGVCDNGIVFCFCFRFLFLFWVFVFVFVFVFVCVCVVMGLDRLSVSMVSVCGSVC